MTAAPAPLISIPEAPAPAGGGAEWVQGADGARLRAALFMPDGAARGTVVVSPGRTEPIEKYFEVVGELQARGFAALVHDWRGHGLSARLTSDPMKGHADGWRLFLGDFQALLDGFEARAPKPWILLAHSMGAGLGLLALVEGERRFQAGLLTSPMLGLRLPLPPSMARAVVSGLIRVGRGEGMAPAQPANLIDLAFEQNVLTHDRDRWDRTIAQLRAAPELQLGGVTWGWLSFALELGPLVAGRAAALTLPLAILAAGEERLVSNSATRALVARAPHASYVEIAGAYHELLMETDAVRAEVWRAFDALVSPPRPSPRPRALTGHAG